MSDDTDLVPSPAPRKQGHRNGGPKVNLNWREVFLTAYEQTGGFYVSAKTAGIDSTTAYDERHRNPAFDRACEEAKQRYADSREANLARLADNGNVVGDIVLLKKFRPHEYIEKNLSITATFNAELDPQQGQQLLAAMLQTMSPTSVQHLAPRVIETADRVLPGPDATTVTRDPGHDGDHAEA